MLQSGLDQYWRDRNYPAVSARARCRNLRQSKGLRELKLYDLQSSFLILAVGSALAVVAFLLEVAVYKKTRSARQSLH